MAKEKNLTEIRWIYIHHTFGVAARMVGVSPSTLGRLASKMGWDRERYNWAVPRARRAQAKRIRTLKRKRQIKVTRIRQAKDILG